MLSDYFEDFVLLERTGKDDELGGCASAWTDGLTFCGGVTQVLAKEIELGEASARRVTPVLLHDWDVTLSQGDLVRRVRDGAVYRVTGHSGDMRTPPLAGVLFCQVPVERLVTAP